MIDKSKAFKPIYDGIEKTLDDLSISKEFYLGLMEDKDDWSFVIKVHAFIESAITHLLTTQLGKPELQDIISKIDISNLSTGRLAFIKTLKLLPKKYITFIHSLSTLRNSLVHNVQNVNFTFAEHMQKLDEKELKKFLKEIGSIIGDLVPYLNKNLSKEEFIKKFPRETIFQGSVCIVGRIYLHKIGYKLRDEPA